MKDFNQSKLKAFLEGQASFDLVCLEDLFLLCCLIQEEKIQLTIYINSDKDANPISIEIFDELNILDSLTFKSEYLNFFSQESDFIKSDLIIVFDEEYGYSTSEISFVDEDLDLSSVVKKTSLLKTNVENLAVTDAWHSNLQQFVLNAI